MAEAVWSARRAAGSVCFDGMISMVGRQSGAVRSWQVTREVLLETSAHVWEPTTSSFWAPRSPLGPPTRTTAYWCARVHAPLGGGITTARCTGSHTGVTATGVCE